MIAEANALGKKTAARHGPRDRIITVRDALGRSFRREFAVDDMVRRQLDAAGRPAVVLTRLD